MHELLHRVAVFDCETDPFEYNAEIRAFSCEFLHGSAMYQFWGDDCISQFLEFIRDYPGKCIIYVHNGGRFDVFQRDMTGASLLAAAGQNVKIINRRIAKMTIGEHE